MLLADFRAEHPHHTIARGFLDAAQAGQEPIGLSTIVLSSVVRMATNARVFPRPDATDAVLEYVDALLKAPGRIIADGAGHWPRLVGLCRDLQLRGNHVPDAHLAAIALESRAELVTFDRDFGRYPGLRWRCLLDA